MRESERCQLGSRWPQCALAGFEVCVCGVCNGLDRANMPEQQQLQILNTHQCVRNTTQHTEILSGNIKDQHLGVKHTA